jgi:uncharacterized protein involved in exopolysaccharide biosynthesis
MAEAYTSRTLREIVRIVASRFIGMTIILVIVIGGVTLASLYAPKWYRSEVQLLATPARNSGPLEASPVSTKEQVQLFVSTQRDILMSDYVLASALMKLDPEFESRNGSRWNEAGKKPWFTQEEVDRFISENGDLLRRFKSRVTVVTPGGPDATFTQTFKIRVDWPEIRQGEMADVSDTRAQAAENVYKLTKYIVKAYLTRFSILEQERAMRANEFIKNKALKTAQERLDKATKELAAYSEKLGSDLMTVSSILGLQGVDSGPSAQVTRLETQVDTNETRLIGLTQLKASIETELAKLDPTTIAVPDEVIAANLAIGEIQSRLITLQLQLNNLEPQYTGEYRKIANARDELTAGYATLQAELQKQLERTEATINILQAEQKKLKSSLQEFKSQMNRLGGEATHYQRLKQAFDTAMTLYEGEEGKWLESVRRESLAENPILVSVLDDPTWPDPADPRRPLIWLNVLVSIAGGLVLALAYAFMADHFDHTIKSVDDAERYVGTPVLASMPKLGRRIIRH